MHEELAKALSEKTLIAIEREGCDPGHDIGYVAGLGQEFVLLLCVSNEIRLNGFSLLRLGDISDLEIPHEHDAFVESALRLRGDSVDVYPKIDLSSLEAALRSANRLFPVLSLHQEITDPDDCLIGKVLTVGRTQLEFIEIDPDAEWSEEPSSLPLADLTRIDFGGGYEDALFMVGGPCPSKHVLREVT
jgi:hypothetical protein